VDELAHPKYRGFIISSAFTFASIGILAISSLGAFVDWRKASAIAALPSVINIILLYFLHESPTWFVKRNRMAEAEKALQWLWGPDNEEQVSVCGYTDGVMNCK
jgi:SP family facilitated glucose transporter-like MFS transporter 8